MNTQIYKIDENDISIEGKNILQRAGEIIKDGGLVAFPTETVYGLGANAFNKDAINRIYTVKGRPSNNPLIVHIADKKDLAKIVSEVSLKAKKLINKFWPGPLTIILERNENIPLEVTGGLETVAVRLPDNNIARQIIRYSKGFIAAPSANLSGKPSPTKGTHVIDDFDGAIDMIIDGGDNDIGIESTIIDLSVEPPVILRPGFITKQDIEDVIGLVVDPSETDAENEKSPKAPGMMYKHYAPQAKLILVEGSKDIVINAINEFVEDDSSNGIRVGVITTGDTNSYNKKALVRQIAENDDIDIIGKNLYTVLREFDTYPDIKKIYSPTFSDAGFGAAVMNRLTKAAAGEIINVGVSDSRRDIKTVVFISDEDTSRGPMACAILKSCHEMKGMNVLSRGLNVLFREPINAKVSEVLKSKGLDLGDYKSTELSEEDISIDTLYITMNLKEKIHILKKYPGVVYIFTISEYIGEKDDEVMTPFGENIEEYYKFFDIMEKKVLQMVSVRE